MSTWLFLIFQFTPLYRRNRLSQRQLAKRVGVTPGYISKLEKANKIDGLSFSMLINLSQALKVLPIALISNEEIEKAWAKQKEAEAKAKEAEENK